MQELKIEDRVKGGGPNRARIAECIEKANISLANQTELDWALSYENRYQMANRFAWSWKLTELGYPVVLVYLGFLMAEESLKRRSRKPKPAMLSTPTGWRSP